MSSDLTWMIVRNNHAYLHKKRNIKVPFSSEPGNLKNINSLRFNGFVNRRPLVMKPPTKGKGVELSFKTNKNLYKPACSTLKRKIKRTGRPALKAIKKFFKDNNYPKSLQLSALRRMSAIHRSQKAIPFKSKRAKRRLYKAGKSTTKQPKTKKAE